MTEVAKKVHRQYDTVHNDNSNLLAVTVEIHPSNEQMNDAGLFAWRQRFPDWVERRQRLGNFPVATHLPL